MATGDRDDRPDAMLILNVARALRAWRLVTGRQPPTKPLREAVWFFWQRPRLQRPLVQSKYPRVARWSPAAAELLATGGDVRGQLVIEHVEPMNRVLAWLLDEADDVEEVTVALRARLDVVVVTASESRLLPDAGSPEERYRQAGLDLATFAPLAE